MTNLKVNENLVLRETEYRGLSRLKKNQLDVAIKGEFGQGMIGINLKKMEEQIESGFIEISNIRAEKIYPDKVVFQVEEKTAKLVLVNFNGKFLFDDKGEVLKSICRDDIQKFNGFDYLMARGFGDPNGDYVEDIAIAELGEDVEIEEFDFTQFPFEDKVKILDKLQSDKQQNFEQETVWVMDNLDLKLDMDISVIKSWSEDCFTAGDKWDGELINFLADANKIIKVDLEYEVLDAKWDGEFRLIFILSNGTQIILSPSRTLDIQIEDLESILTYSKKTIYDYKLIDLSSQKVLVE
ncbi:FtsQ-type POTRA domain-containing protein [Candidatus Dojkabacteria bacterium]|nr:FtsQ-type POTRA domain-containing protein [Candidatus Dojkabacteria bacterium]